MWTLPDSMMAISLRGVDRIRQPIIPVAVAVAIATTANALR
jgi:hypothetical protein